MQDNESESSDKSKTNSKESNLNKQEFINLLGINDFSLYQHINNNFLTILANELTENKKSTTGISHTELHQKFNSISLDQPLLDEAKVLTELHELYIKDAVYYHSASYLAHLNCPVMHYSVAADNLATCLNTAVETWDQSAGATFIEQSLINWCATKIGYQEGFDGVFTTGGTQSNLVALLLAREAKTAELPDASIDKYVIFSSDFSHCSIKRSAFIAGLGYKSVVNVACDADFKMQPADLIAKIEKAIKEGLIPIAVVATAGTTDFGSIDPLIEIAEICQQHGCWFHVDAAYGGGLLISNNYFDYLTGIEAADSVALDFHKSYFQPLCCAAILLKDKTNFSYISYYADYLNPQDQEDAGVPNLANKSIQTSRRFDALKLWVSLRLHGGEAIGAMFDQAIETAAKVYQYMQTKDQVELLHKPTLSTIVFRFYNSSLVQAANDKWNRHIKDQLHGKNNIVIAATKIKGVQHLKFTILNPATSSNSICKAVDQMTAVASAILAVQRVCHE